MHKMSRRQVLTALGAAGAAFSVSGTGVKGRPTFPALNLDELANRIVETTEADVYQLGAEAIRGGATQTDLMAAAFLAGMKCIRPNPINSGLHAMMMVASAQSLSGSASTEESWLLAMWCLRDVKSWQVREAPWRMSQRKTNLSSLANPARELAVGIRDWNIEQTERAAITLLRQEPGNLDRVLWPQLTLAAGRCFMRFGHKVLYGVQVRRTLHLLPPNLQETALRSLIMAALDREPEPQTAVFQKGLNLVESFPKSWANGKESSRESIHLLTELRSKTPLQIQEILIDAVRDGMGSATVWDGLRLLAAEVMHRRPNHAKRRHLPVHPITELNAFRHAWLANNKNPLLLLVGAGWLGLWLDVWKGEYGSIREGDAFNLEVMGLNREAGNLSQVLQQRDGPGLVATLNHHPQKLDEVNSQLRLWMCRKSVQDHNIKYLAAVFEEMAWTHPNHQGRILAPALTYLPGFDDRDSEINARSIKALRSAGVLS